MSQNVCKSYLLEVQQGIHQWGVDVFKLALFTSGAVLDPLTTTVYSALNESGGTGYPAGGFVLALKAGFPKLSPTASKSLISFDDIAVNPAFFATRYGLIYNSSKANRAFAVLDWGIGYFATIDFGIQWPTSDDDNCIIRLGA